MNILRSIFDKLRGRGSSQQTGAQSTTTASSQPSGQAGQQAMLQNVDVERVLAEMASKKGGGGKRRQGSGKHEALGASPGDQSPDDENHDGPHNRADEPGAFARRIPAKRLP